MAPKNFSIVSECPIIGDNLIGAVVLLDTAGIPGEVKGKRWLAGKVVPIAEEGEAALDELDKKREPLANFCIKFNKTGALGSSPPSSPRARTGWTSAGCCWPPPDADFEQ